jgi:hypothetical protein
MCRKSKDAERESPLTRHIRASRAGLDPSDADTVTPAGPFEVGQIERRRISQKVRPSRTIETSTNQLSSIH